MGVAARRRSVSLGDPPTVATALPLLTLATGVAIAEGVAAARARVRCSSGRTTCTSLGASWPACSPNAARQRTGSHVVVGMGINVSAASYPPVVAARATSIETELGRPVDRGAVLTECLAALWSSYAALQAGNAARVLDAWRGRAATMLRRPVEWTGERGETQRGTAERIDDSGALVVSTRQRRRAPDFRCGDVAVAPLCCGAVGE